MGTDIKIAIAIPLKQRFFSSVAMLFIGYISCMAEHSKPKLYFFYNDDNQDDDDSQDH